MKKFYVCFLLILFGILSAKTAFAYIQIDSTYSGVSGFTVTPQKATAYSNCTNCIFKYDSTAKKATVTGTCSVSLRTVNLVKINSTAVCEVYLGNSCYNAGTLTADAIYIVNHSPYTCTAKCSSGFCLAGSGKESTSSSSPTKSVYAVTITK